MKLYHVRSFLPFKRKLFCEKRMTQGIPFASFSFLYGSLPSGLPKTGGVSGKEEKQSDAAAERRFKVKTKREVCSFLLLHGECVSFLQHFLYYSALSRKLQ